MADQVDPKFGWQAFAIGSAVFAAMTAILGKLGVSDLNSDVATLLRTVVILVMTAGWIAFRHEWEPLSRLTRFGTSMIVLSGIATGLSWLCYYRALQMAPASQVVAIDKLSVAIAIAIAVTFLGEPLTWRIAVGGAMIVAGSLLVASQV